MKKFHILFLCIICIILCPTVTYPSITQLTAKLITLKDQLKTLKDTLPILKASGDNTQAKKATDTALGKKNGEQRGKDDGGELSNKKNAVATGSPEYTQAYKDAYNLAFDAARKIAENAQPKQPADLADAIKEFNEANKTSLDEMENTAKTKPKGAELVRSYDLQYKLLPTYHKLRKFYQKQDINGWTKLGVNLDQKTLDSLEPESGKLIEGEKKFTQAYANYKTESVISKKNQILENTLFPPYKLLRNFYFSWQKPDAKTWKKDTGLEIDQQTIDALEKKYGG